LLPHSLLKKVSVNIQPTVEHTQDVYDFIGFEQIWNSVMAVEQNANVKMLDSFKSIT
jgi:hypothetical protein